MPDNKAERPRVYLNSVHIKGYKSIEDLTIDFQKGLNILIGKNGAGKSNFLDVVDKAIEFKNHSKISYRYSQLKFISDDDHTFVFETEREAHSKVGRDNLLDRLDLSEKVYIDNKIVFNNVEDIDDRRGFEFQGRKISYRTVFFGLFQYLGFQHIYSLYIKYNLPENLACIDSPGTLKANIEDDEITYWDFPDSLNFIDGIIWELGLFYEGDPDKLKDISAKNIYKTLKIQGEIIANLKQYTSIEDVRFNSNINLYRDEKSIIVENVRLDFKVNGNWLPWSQLSDGTRRLFYIISEITYSDGIILIEEPELGIHPHQFNLLMDFLKEQSEDKQIIISTHSPKALDHLSEDELGNILIAYYELGKGTQIRHLTEKEEKKAKRYMKEVGFFSDYWMLSDLE